MSFVQKFSKLSTKARFSWILGLLLVFAVTMAITAAPNFYNQFAGSLASATNNIVVLPKVPDLPYSLGLDLQGGAHLVYQADVNNIPENDRDAAMESVRDVVERRVNTFGVSEPLVQVNKGMNDEYRVIVELAGIKNVSEAIKMIGETPILEFKEQGEVQLQADASSTIALDANAIWKNTELTGKYLKRASLQFNPNDGSPEVSLEFNDEGAKLFEDITARNIGKPVAIFLDGYPISVPTVNDKITGGQASISGRFNIEEAKLLVTRLNSGALPVPISLVAEKTLEASLGTKSVSNSLQAGLAGLLLVSIFMILYYRLPGLLSVLSLIVYGLTVLSIFKALPLWLALTMAVVIIGLIFYVFNELKIFNGALASLFIVIGCLLFFYALKPVTLSLSGIAGFILSIGIAVDANVLIFARMKEEYANGKSVSQSVSEGFKRAWPSIRDGNISTILTCLVLMFFGTSAVQGFGTTLFLGISVSLFSSIVITHTLLTVLLGPWAEKFSWLLGLRRTDNQNSK